MPIWFLLDAKSKYPDGTTFVLDCDACASRYSICYCDVKSNAPMSDLMKEIDSTDWQVMQSDRPGVTIKFICPTCQAERRDSRQFQLPDVTPETGFTIRANEGGGRTA
jgi:DNA-directed RNA polymerase subunit M/transcription elongation factor TFIIS